MSPSKNNLSRQQGTIHISQNISKEILNPQRLFFSLNSLPLFTLRECACAMRHREQSATSPATCWPQGLSHTPGLVWQAPVPLVFCFPLTILFLLVTLCHERRKLYKSIHDIGKPLLFRIHWIQLENASSVLNKAPHQSKSLNYVPVKQNIRKCVYIHTLFIWVHLDYKSPQSPLRVLGSSVWVILKSFFFQCFREAWFGILTYNVVVLFNFATKNILWLNSRQQNDFKSRVWLH
jgi:hypothetical protein